MKKKLLKSIVSTIMVLVISMSLCATALAHTNPSTGLPCNNTYYTSSHASLSGMSNAGSHTLTSGATCQIYGLTFYHDKYCTSCSAYVGSYTKSCTIDHDICPIYSSNCY
jgi:uncharacterized protein YceK